MDVIAADAIRWAALVLGVLCLAFILATLRIYNRRGGVGPYIRWMSAFGTLAVVSLSLSLPGPGEPLTWQEPTAAAAFACLLMSFRALRRHYHRR